MRTRARRGTLHLLLHAPCKGPARRGRRLHRTAREQLESILHHLALLMPVPITLHAPASVVAPPDNSPRASRLRRTRRTRRIGMREAINGTQRQSVALEGNLHGHLCPSEAISSNQWPSEKLTCSGPSFARRQKSRRAAAAAVCVRRSGRPDRQSRREHQRTRGRAIKMPRRERERKKPSRCHERKQAAWDARI